MIKEHDRVVLKKEVPEQGLKTGDVGTVIHVHKKDKAFEVEFVALDGETLAHTRIVVQKFQVQWFKVRGQRGSKLSCLESTFSSPRSTTWRFEMHWSEAIAVGSLTFVESVKNELGFKAAQRNVIDGDGSYALRVPIEAYGLKFAAENEALRHQNTFLWNETVDEART